MNFKLGVSNQNQNFHSILVLPFVSLCSSILQKLLENPGKYWKKDIHAFFIENMRPAFCKSHLKSEKYFQSWQNVKR